MKSTLTSEIEIILKYINIGKHFLFRGLPKPISRKTRALIFINNKMAVHKWWHRFVRRRTRPIPEDTAVLWKRRLSIAYGILAWNAFGVLAYSVYQGKMDWAHYHGLKTDEERAARPAASWADTLGIRNAKVYRISGLTKVHEYEIKDGEIIEEQKKSSEIEELNE